jgi:imidazoleglycerol-phosphate dehydratase
MRNADIKRKTGETEISIKLNLDGSGKAAMDSKVGFLNHMLESLAKHGMFDIEASMKGDLHVDQHHTVEDTGIALGQAFKEALGDRRGIRRAGCFSFPMDEALATAAVDISGRPHLRFRADFKGKKVGEMPLDLVEDFFQGFVSASGMTVHLKVSYGRSDHHKVEALFKAFALALRDACTLEPRLGNDVPSTKGML